MVVLLVTFVITKGWLINDNCTSFIELHCINFPDICPEKEALVREELQIDKECLGFKYWIIKSNPALERTFAADIIWNKK